MASVKYFLFLFSLFYTNHVFAFDTLPPAEIYAKCYAKISDHPVEFNTTMYQNVITGKIDPIVACMSLLNKAMFTKQQDNKRQIAANNEMTKSIVRTFHQLHLSWFSNIYTDPSFDSLMNFNDNNEPALFLTDALFSNKHFKTITTSNEPLRGIRETPNASPYYVYTTNFDNAVIAMGPMISTKPIPANKDNFVEVTGSRVPSGALLGIETAPSVIVSLPQFIGKTPLTEPQMENTSLYNGTQINLNNHFGGGLLGSISLFYNNTETMGTLDGGLRVRRRWANNIYNDLLCSTLPSLKESDPAVTQEFNTFSAQHSELSFRTNKTCLRCHTSLDNLAHVARNVFIGRLLTIPFQRDFFNDYVKPKIAKPLLAVYQQKVSKTTITPIDTDKLYQRRTPQGALVFNDYNGNYWNQPVTGLQQLGEKIATHDDMYICAAKKYYAFLTGVDADLTPIAIDSNGKPKNSNDQFAFFHRNQIISLGKTLKTNGSLKLLIQNILKSPAFTARNPAEVGGD
ncbi:MAG: hypothetical protein H6623_08120 [Bdellovibrionaceae bacterium]|nr:hypothetical protein [Pseudobdellovibrionaceae bacterium]